MRDRGCRIMLQCKETVKDNVDVASWALGPSYVICSTLGSVMEVTAITLPCYAGR